ncbi:hypothetical protein ACVXG9_13395 [Escherichia coli]
MNRISYKLKFDKRRNELVVVSEITTGVVMQKPRAAWRAKSPPVVACAPWR